MCSYRQDELAATLENNPHQKPTRWSAGAGLAQGLALAPCRLLLVQGVTGQVWTQRTSLACQSRPSQAATTPWERTGPIHAMCSVLCGRCDLVPPDNIGQCSTTRSPGLLRCQQHTLTVYVVPLALTVQGWLARANSRACYSPQKVTLAIPLLVVGWPAMPWQSTMLAQANRNACDAAQSLLPTADTVGHQKTKGSSTCGEQQLDSRLMVGPGAGTQGCRALLQNAARPPNAGERVRGVQGVTPHSAASKQCSMLWPHGLALATHSLHDMTDGRQQHLHHISSAGDLPPGHKRTTSKAHSRFASD